MISPAADTQLMTIKLTSRYESQVLFWKSTIPVQIAEVTFINVYFCIACKINFEDYDLISVDEDTATTNMLTF